MAKRVKEMQIVLTGATEVKKKVNDTIKLLEKSGVSVIGVKFLYAHGKVEKPARKTRSVTRVQSRPSAGVTETTLDS